MAALADEHSTNILTPQGTEAEAQKSCAMRPHVIHSAVTGRGGGHTQAILPPQLLPLAPPAASAPEDGEHRCSESQERLACRGCLSASE